LVGLRLATATYLPKTEFSKQLDARVEDYFVSTAQSRRDVPRMYLKTAVMLAWLGGAYLILMFGVTTWWQAVLAAVALGLAAAGVGFNIQHDGGHGGYSSRAWVNKMMALSLDLLGGTAYFWHYKHNIAHHTHPNVQGHDDDINLGPLGRVSPHQKWRPYHRFQFAYLWAFYSLLAVEWQITGEFRNFISKRTIGSTRVPFPRGREQLIFWLGKLTFFSLAFVLPISMHSFGRVMGVYGIAAATLGLVLATVFQLAHCSDEAQFRMPPSGSVSVARPWAEHQVETAVDFARGNRMLSWYLGGLNFQIEHHLFPKICHVHYAALAPIIEDVCRSNGVRYFCFPTARAAFRAHVRWLVVMGRRPVAPAVNVV
jgi:linoleoyl-CoA desaturase